MKTRLYAFYLILSCCFFISCEVINPDETEPAYIYIESFEFESPPEAGTSSESITELWVFANGKNVGIYDLPARVPILQHGDVDITIAAGIKNNGISSTRIVYPFYTTYEETVNLQPLETDTIEPYFTYRDDLTFFTEAFEDPGIKFDELPNSDTTMNITNEESLVFEGTGSGVIYLDEERPYYLGQTDDNLDLPAGQFIFAEINFKSNNSFVVGLLAESAQDVSRDFALVVNPSDQSGVPEWRKLYVDLGFVAALSPTATSFEFYIEAGKDSDNTTAQIYFDNIKIVYR